MVAEKQEQVCPVKIIVDTNIFISALLSPKGNVLELLMNPWAKGIFYTCDFLRQETLKHKEKIVRLSGLSEIDLLNLIMKVSGRMNFINEEQIPENAWREAYAYTKDVDESDTPFLALALHLRGALWTGDKKLIKGLSVRGFKNVKTTRQVKRLISK